MPPSKDRRRLSRSDPGGPGRAARGVSEAVPNRAPRHSGKCASPLRFRSAPLLLRFRSASLPLSFRSASAPISWAAIKSDPALPVLPRPSLDVRARGGPRSGAALRGGGAALCAAALKENAVKNHSCCLSGTLRLLRLLLKKAAANGLASTREHPF